VLSHPGTFGLRQPYGVFRFVITAILLAGAFGMSLLPTRRHVVIKLCYVAFAALAFRHWNIALAGEGWEFFAFGAMILAAVSFPSPFFEQRRQPWWPAVRRTLRRLRGDWNEDDAQSAAKIFGQKEQPR